MPLALFSHEKISAICTVSLFGLLFRKLLWSAGIMELLHTDGCCVM